MVVASAVGAALTVIDQVIWSRGFSNLDARIEENREQLSALMPGYPPSKPVIITGGTFLLGPVGAFANAPFGVLRPLLPANDGVAGAMYTLGWSAVGLEAIQQARRHYSLGHSRPQRPVWQYGAFAIHGALIGSAVGAYERHRG